ncbi:hypothetical protein PMAYCL1PPCAC_15727, partial [Pristionchus mayeri]
QAMAMRRGGNPWLHSMPAAHNPHSNLSTVTINNGREIRTIPAYLRQFEMSRQVSTTSRACVPSTVEVVDEPIDERAAPRKTRNMFVRGAVAVLSRHRRFGFRHTLLAIVLALYTLAGMFMF